MDAEHIRFAGAALAVGLLATACSSSGNSGTSSNASNGAAAGGAAASTNSGSSGSTVTIEAHSGPHGSYLTDSTGKSLYMFASDTSSKSTCPGSCAAFWPPLTTSGTAKASGGASGTVATITRSDGSKQVTYDGHPLYYFKLDSKAGDTKGEGRADFGAKWWLLSPSGKQITNTAAGSSSSSSSGGGGGGWG